MMNDFFHGFCFLVWSFRSFISIWSRGERIERGQSRKGDGHIINAELLGGMQLSRSLIFAITNGGSMLLVGKPINIPSK